MNSRGIALVLSVITVGACVEVPDTQSLLSSLPETSRSSKSARAADSVLLAMRTTDGTTYNVQSDGLGEYVHGSAGISAMIDLYGNLQIASAAAPGAIPATRRLKITYGSAQPYTYPNQVNFKITSNRTNNANPRLQDMAVGSALCYNVSIAHRDDTVQLVNRYNPAAYTGSTYVLITRGSTTSWMISSSGVATTGLLCGAPDIAWVTGTDLLVKRGGAFTVGASTQAFLIELRALP